MKQSLIKKKHLGDFAKKNALLWMLICMVAVFSMSAQNFFTSANGISILRQVAVLGIMSCGMSFVLIGGNFDLTAGSIVSLSCVIIVRVFNLTNSEFIAIFVALFVGMACGTLTGLIVSYSKLNSMIAGLGLQSAYFGFALICSEGKFYYIDDTKTWLDVLGRSSILHIPVQVWIYAVMVVIFQYILVKTKFGKYVFIAGSNKKAAVFSGIDERAVIAKTYILSGFCAAFAGVITAARSMAAQANVGDGYEFEVITACILSGTSIMGGEGSVLKAMLGIIIMGVLKNGFVMLSLPYYVQWLAQCVIIITIVGIDIKSRKKVNAA